jgi:hypothetical protein
VLRADTELCRERTTWTSSLERVSKGKSPVWSDPLWTRSLNDGTKTQRIGTRPSRNQWVGKHKLMMEILETERSAMIEGMPSTMSTNNEMERLSSNCAYSAVLTSQHGGTIGADRLDIHYKLIASSWCSLRPI